MKNLIKIYSTILLLAICSISQAATVGITHDNWRIEPSTTNGINISNGEKIVGSDIYAAYRLDYKYITSRDYELKSINKESVSDAYGEGIVCVFSYQRKGFPDLVYKVYLYDSSDYCLIDFTLSSKATIATNYMSALNSKNIGLPQSETQRALFIPFDNDKWIRYKSQATSFDRLRSYEATAIYDTASNEGFIVGSVDHTFWKSAIDMIGVNNSIASLDCFAGVADEFTRDAKPHAALEGKNISSPRFFVGRYDDWREGLNEFADVNVKNHPKMAYDGDVPFGWNSWGALKFNLNYDNASEVSQFINKELQAKSFANNKGSMVMWLDSGWNKFSDEQLKEFVKNCNAQNQEAGIYWTPFAEWSKDGEKSVQYATEYKNKDVYLYANNRAQRLDNAYAFDPTHPAVEARMKAVAKIFRDAGYKYVKLDFMTHGILEADSWYNKDIKSGVEAYRYGMELIAKHFEGIYINLSIAPLFPSEYGHSRRIACDAWNKIKDTEYTMNALSYGWWTSRLYHYNDADHIVLRDATEGENRARITSSAMTGLYICGDDFSVDGDGVAKERAIKYLTNPDINRMANGVSFMPVYGDGKRSENHFVRLNDDGSCYYTIFNYGTTEESYTIELSKLPLRGGRDYKLKELWSGCESTSSSSELSVTIPQMDVKVFYIY